MMPPATADPLTLYRTGKVLLVTDNAQEALVRRDRTPNTVIVAGQLAVLFRGQLAGVNDALFVIENIEVNA